MSVQVKRGDWVIMKSDTAGKLEGLVRRLARDGSWADVDWGHWSKRMQTEQLIVVATIQRGAWAITDVTRANELDELRRDGEGGE